MRAQPILGTRWRTELAPLPGSHVDSWQQLHLISLFMCASGETAEQMEASSNCWRHGSKKTSFLQSSLVAIFFF